MCIMEVRAGQRSSTIAQACAHNVGTIERDVDMFMRLLRARHDPRAADLDRAQDELRRAYANLLELFGEFVADEVQMVPSLIHQHPDDGRPIGGERTLVAQAHHDAQLARQHEGR